MTYWILGFVVSFAAGMSIAHFALSRRLSRRSEEAYVRGVEVGREAMKREMPVEKRLIKVTLPDFGKPELKVYDPLQFSAPISCEECKKVLVVGENYYEIPIMNQPGSVVAVHLRCERELKYG